MRLLSMVVVVLAPALDLSAASAQSPAQSAPAVTAAVPAPARDPSLPPSEQEAKASLEKSPRHGEFVDVPMPSGGPVKTWIVYPERKDRAGVVLVIHEIFGLSDWIRGVADQFAHEGFIASRRT